MTGARFDGPAGAGEAPRLAVGRSSVFLLSAAAIYQAVLAVYESRYNHRLLLFALPVVVLAWCAVGARRELVCSRRVGFLAAAILLLVQVIVLFAGWCRPTDYFAPRNVFESILPWLGVTAVALLGWGAVAAPRLGGRWLVLAVAVHIAVSWVVVHRSPHPPIDVYDYHQEAAAALLRGENPYAITVKNIYLQPDGSPSPYYPPEIQREGRLQFGFPYPPLNLWLYLPSYWLTGEARYAHALAYALAGWILACIGRGRVSRLAGVLLLAAPACRVVMENAWTEPFELLGLATVTLAAVRAPRLLPVSLGLFLALKQYNVIFLPLLWLLLPRPLSIRSTARFLLPAVVAGALVTLPLALWNAAAFWHSAVAVQIRQPLRVDSFSFLAWIARLQPAGYRPPGSWTLIAFLLLLPTWALLLRRLPRSGAGFALGAAVTMIMFLFFNRQAFLNYHTFAAGALLVAASALAAARAGPEDVNPP